MTDNEDRLAKEATKDYETTDNPMDLLGMVDQDLQFDVKMRRERNVPAHIAIIRDTYFKMATWDGFLKAAILKHTSIADEVDIVHAAVMHQHAPPPDGADGSGGNEVANKKVGKCTGAWKIKTMRDLFGSKIASKTVRDIFRSQVHVASCRMTRMHHSTGAGISSSYH
jgi:hypothetical protein